MRIAAVIAVTALITIGVLASLRKNDPAGGDPLVATLRLPDERHAGEPVPLELHVANTSGETLSLVYEYELPYVFRISYPPAGDEIFEAWVSPFRQATNTTVRELPAGEKLVFRATWDQTDYVTGSAVPPGVYNIQGRHMGHCEPQYCLVRDYSSFEIVR